MNPIRELENIFDSIHNVKSTSTKPIEFEDMEDEHTDNMFDKYVLRWF